mmetsp:Transcript_18247/g.52737  ORF Transcript_18247/g.52737 Transcript_18247/m.52737 type:complete len:215 (+) Transcript_18247:280-924(+)
MDHTVGVRGLVPEAPEVRGATKRGEVRDDGASGDEGRGARQPRRVGVSVAPAAAPLRGLRRLRARDRRHRAVERYPSVAIGRNVDKIPREDRVARATVARVARVHQSVAAIDPLDPAARILAATPLLAGRRLGHVVERRAVGIRAEAVIVEHHAEALLVPAPPLEVVHQRPCEVPADIDVVLVDRLAHLCGVVCVVGDARGVGRRVVGALVRRP